MLVIRRRNPIIKTAVALAIAGSGYYPASPFALEVLNIKPAGTGTPVLPSTNRIFHAYPGLPYQIRAGVRGGKYPYTFALSNAPPGMTVNRYGTIDWPNPTSDAGPITLTVTDQDGAQATGQWSISVHTSGFWFVNGDYVGTSTGSITQPFKTMNEMAAATQGHPTDIVYIRQTASPYTPGKYPANGITDFTAESFHLNYYSVVSAPETLLAYPGESPVLDFQNLYYLTTTGPYLDGITLRNGKDYLLQSSSIKNYQTVRRCVFDTVSPSVAINNNQGGWFVSSDGQGYFLLLQDNEMKNFLGAEGVGSFYAIDGFLGEDNYTHDGGLPGLVPYATPIGLKNRVTNWTLRRNTLLIPTGARRWELYDSQSGGTPFDLSYNLVISESNADIIEITDPDNGYIYRNTVLGNIVFTPPNGDPDHSSSGPFLLTSNVIQGLLVNTAGSNVTEVNNLRGAWGAGFVDVNGLLTGAYRAQYLYQVGHELPP